MWKVKLLGTILGLCLFAYWLSTWPMFMHLAFTDYFYRTPHSVPFDVHTQGATATIPLTVNDDCVHGLAIVQFKDERGFGVKLGNNGKFHIKIYGDSLLKEEDITFTPEIAVHCGIGKTGDKYEYRKSLYCLELPIGGADNPRAEVTVLEPLINEKHPIMKDITLDLDPAYSL